MEKELEPPCQHHSQHLSPHLRGKRKCVCVLPFNKNLTHTKHPHSLLPSHVQNQETSGTEQKHQGEGGEGEDGEGEEGGGGDE